MSSWAIYSIYNSSLEIKQEIMCKAQFDELFLPTFWNVKEKCINKVIEYISHAHFKRFHDIKNNIYSFELYLYGSPCMQVTTII